MYFSWTQTHGGISKSKRQEWLSQGIDNFVVEKSNDYFDRYHKYLSYFSHHQNVTLLKYEDLILNFDKWLELFLKNFTLTQSDKLILSEEFKSQVEPKTANKNTHKRKMVPGDFKNNLKPETIDFLNQKFYNILLHLDYEI